MEKYVIEISKYLGTKYGISPEKVLDIIKDWDECKDEFLSKTK